MMDFTPIFQALVALICAVVTVVIVPWIKSKTTAEQQERINLMISVAVQAAEQFIVGTGVG